MKVKRCTYKNKDKGWKGATTKTEKIRVKRCNRNFFWGSCNRWWPISSQAERSIWLYCLSWTTLCRAFDRFRRENKFFSECTSRLSEVIQAVLLRQSSGFMQRNPLLSTSIFVTPSPDLSRQFVLKYFLCPWHHSQERAILLCYLRTKSKRLSIDTEYYWLTPND